MAYIYKNLFPLINHVHSMKHTDNYQNIVSEIEDYAILLLDKSGTVMDWNRGAEKLKGYSAEEIIGKNFRLFYTEEDCTRNLPGKLIREAIEKGKATDEGWRVRKNGSRFWGSILITALHEKGLLTGFLKITRDLTEKKEVEEKLKLLNGRLEQQVEERGQKLMESEREFRHTLDNMLEGVQIHDFDWKYIYANDALVNYSTYSRNELLGFTLMEKYPGIGESALFKTLQRCMTERKSEKTETEFVFPNGTTGYFEISIQPVPEGLFILSVDKTAQKKAQEKIIKANRLYNFISNINKSIVHITEQGKLLDTACAIATEIGRFKMAWIGLTDENGLLNRVSFSGDQEAADRIMQPSGLDPDNPLHKDIPTVKVLRTGKYIVNNDIQNDPLLSHWKAEFVAQHIRAAISLPIIKAGKVAGVFGFFSTVKDFFDVQEISLLEEAAGDISFALGFFDKTTKHRETEQLLLRNEKRFRALIEKSTDMKTLTNRQGEFIYGSPSITKVFGYSPDEFLNKSIFNFIHPDDLPGLMESRAAILETPEKSFHFQYRLSHKLGHWIWCEGMLTNMLDDPAINALVSNFRDISENKIAEQQQQFNRNNLYALINNTNAILWSIDTDYKLITCNRPFQEIIRQTSGREMVAGESVFSGAWSDEQKERFKRSYDRAFSGEVFTELEYMGSPAEAWSEISFYPIRNNGVVIGTACHSRDITLRIKQEQEREKMIADIIQRNKSFEQFAYIVSHNLRAPVANIMGISQMLQKNIAGGERKKAEGFLYKAVQHMDDIVRDLSKILQVKMEIAGHKERVFFSSLVKDIEFSIENVMEKQDVGITTDFSAVDQALILKSYIHSIFYNLISNSIKYRHPERRPLINIKSSLLDGKINISFRDNGIGIDLEKHADHIFGLYKRFHFGVEGKGLGLFMVKTQLEVLGGTIRVNSEPGVGTEFIIELPA